MYRANSAAYNRPSVGGTLAGDNSGAQGLPSPAKTIDRPPSLPAPIANDDTLRTYASRIGLYFGSMIDSNDEGWKNASVRNTLSSEFNMMVPGTQLKWATVHPSRDRFYFGPGDALVDFASVHNMKVRGVILVWGMWNPDWLGNEPARVYNRFNSQDLEDILVNHIQTVIGHYRDKYPGVVKWWDVTNELMGWNNKFNSDGIAWSIIGSNPDRADYLRVAFRTARQADPDAVLCMNDWGNEGSIPERTQNMIDAVRAFRAEGIPIDCVGMEAHLNTETAPTYEQTLKVMKTYADMGVQVQVTEFDIEARRSAVNWTKASNIATDILKACVDFPNCTAFNNWGFSQAVLNDANNAKTVTILPWDDKNEKSPIYAAMRDVLVNGPRHSLSRTTRCPINRPPVL